MKTLFINLVLLFSMFPILIAQDTRMGIIAVTAVDLDTREPLVGATVQLVGTSFGGATDPSGTCELKNIPIGSYTVQVTAVGYQKTVRTDVVVNTIKPAVVIIELNQQAVTIGEVNITAGYFQPNPDAPVSARLQSQEELRRLPGGFEDVVRAVSILPGVAQVQAGRNDLVVRGGAPSENLFLVDNIEIPNINHFGTQGASGGPLSYINLDFVDGTMFSAGGFGVRYGGKLSSILAIDLREGRKDRIGGKATLSASQFGLTTEGPLGERGTFLFSARRSYLDFIFKAAGFSFVPEYWDFMGKGTYAFGQSDKLTFMGIGVVDNIRTFADDRNKIYDNSKILLNEQQQWIGGVSLQHLFSGGFATISLAHTVNTFNYLQHDTLLQPVFKSSSDEGTTAFRADAVFHLGQYDELSLGVEAKYQSIDDEMYLAPFWTNYGQQISVAARADTHAIRSGGYLQYSKLAGIFRLTGGMRLDHAPLLHRAWRFTPRGSVSVYLSSLWTATVSAGTYSQAPSLVWMVSNPQNDDLSYMMATQYIASFEYLLKEDFKVGMEGYLKDYRDYPASTLQPFLTLSNTGAGYGGSRDGFSSFGIDPLASIGWGRTKGVELFFQKKLSVTPYYLIGSVTYARADYAGLDGTLRPGAFDQRWIINLGGGYLFDERWEFGAKFRMATGRPYTPYLPNGMQAALQYNSERIGVNHQLDIRVDRRWAFDSFALVGFVDIQNIYNNKPVDLPVYNERKGTTEQRQSIGILPSIGFSAEF